MRVLFVPAALALAVSAMLSPSASAQPVDREIRITATNAGKLTYRDQDGKPADKRQTKRNDRVVWRCCTLPAGETRVAFDVSFAVKTPFPDVGNSNNHTATITKQVRSDADFDTYKYAVAIVTRDAKGNIRLYLDDPEILVEP